MDAWRDGGIGTKVIGDPIDGKEIVFHVVKMPHGWAGILCKDSSCQFTLRGDTVSDEALLAFVKQVVKEEFGVGDDYKVRLVKD